MYLIDENESRNNTNLQKKICWQSALVRRVELLWEELIAMLGYLGSTIRVLIAVLGAVCGNNAAE